MAIPLRKHQDDQGLPPGGGTRVPIRGWSITTWLIVVNVGVFLIDLILRYPLRAWGNFSVEKAIFGMQIWRFFTFQFLHLDIEHLFFNMLSLYFFGQLIETYLGRWRYMAFYLICGMTGALAYLLLWALHILIESPQVQLIGASAGIFGVLVAAAMVAPQMTVRLLFPPISLKMRTMAWIFVGIAVMTIAANGHNAGGEAAHLGGAAAGAILIRKPRWLAVFTRSAKKRSRFWKPGDPASDFFRQDGGG